MVYFYLMIKYACIPTPKKNAINSFIFQGMFNCHVYQHAPIPFPQFEGDIM